ncbi:helix-turn-helix domain-containing protein [Flagellimonas sp. HMM57]|uniref:helix-turn-helix domain-containing protein n=1 Tax=unclassified Flagellimonas TaxID=2644544 RepID=UPI0013D329BC|nr:MULTISPECIES: helix-turn-helix domain-containing protein [unclassified Flagellimonas]UII75100.1 helix-turn-helix domain-containing protein [Flagellimonas sp. HMM57]
MRWSKFFFFLSFICCTFNSVEVYSCYKSVEPNTISVYDSLKWADYYYNIQRYNKAIPIYEKNLVNPDAKKTHILKRLALSEAALNHVDKSTTNLTKYLQLEFEPNFLLNEGFDPIRKEQGFKKISDKVIPKVTSWSLFYLFVATIGFYVVLILCLNKQIYRTSRFLIASFIFIHSFFILHLSINSANYFFQYPHTYLMSTWAIFLYGPLLYFYFKKTTTDYTFRPIDILHLLPSAVLLAYLILNVYTLTEESKITLMLSRMQNGLGPQDSNRLVVLVIFKIISLSVYGYFIGKVYNEGKNNKLLDLKSLTWQKNVYHIHILYVFTYAAYGIVIINGYSNGVLFDISAATMAFMVLYVGYSANIQPDVFSGIYAYKNRLFPKYEKSGLTPSLSDELKENLLHLFAIEKIYKENNISLDMVAKRLNTTRHNASQIINEHFNVSFHEFVNIYRIREAKQLLMDNESHKLNIIHVAYEVGYNNKVTFNKAFKKDTELTPSEFQKAVAKTS